MTEEPKLLTAGVIAERIGQPLSRVTYILGTRPHIRPSARAGNLRLYSVTAIPLIEKELEEIEKVKRERKMKK